jgi:hypothetical protein
MTIIGELAPETTSEIMTEITLQDDVIDLIAASRNTLRVASTKSAIKNGKTYHCSYLLNVPNDLLARLGPEAQKQERTIAGLLRRYTILAFAMCLADLEDDEQTNKAA